MANNWDEFFATPIKASKKLHVTAKDVASGAKIDARRREAELAIQKQSPTYPSRANAAKLDPGARGRDAMFWSAVDATSPAPELSELPSRGAQLARTALSGAGSFGGWADPAIDEPTPDMLARMVGQAVSDPLNAVGLGALKFVGQIAKKALPAAVIGASTGYAADAEAMPFHSWMKRLGVSGLPEKTSLYINPDRGELMQMLKDARETYPTDPTVRLLRDRNSTDIYGVEGSSILHDDMRKHLGMSYERAPGTQGNTLPSLESEMEFLRQMSPGKFAGGGLVKSGLKMMFPNLGAPLHVVKPKGGNWLSGSVEDALKGLKKDEPNSDATWAALPRDLIDKYRHSSGPHQLVQKTHPKEWAAAQQSLQPPINNWIEGPLTKYVKTRMASPEDEVRRLAEEGVLHANNLPDVRPNHLDILKGIRERGGFPREGNSRWEDVADWHAWPTPVESVRRGWFKEPAEARRVTEGSKEWLDKVAPETPIYGYASGIRSLAEDLGFDHLVDELSNALDPNSGLPRHLQLTPEAVKNLSMEKAVRRVADINAWRAAQKVEANRKLAEQASIVREYAENNPKGLRWVELKAPENLTPEQQKYYDKLISVQTDPQVAMGAARKYGTNPLADQLKYEGDTMGHCVGGYCDDVISGRSRIFSLRDAKGEPHVTVEVRPERTRNANEWYAWQKQNPEEYSKLNAEFGEDTDAKLKAAAERYQHPPSIVQIKGKQNRKPNDEYLPFVQDFVKNPPHGAPWGEVGDLQNTGMFKVQQGQKWPGFAEDMPEGFYTLDEAHRLATEKGMDPEVLDRWMAKLKNPYQEFASGGSVGVPAAGWELLTDPTGSPTENKLSWDIFSGHNDAEQLEALE